MTRPTSPLPIEARRRLWDQLWERLLQPLPSEVVKEDDHPEPSDETDQLRTKEVGR
jgi:hypothetical protein